jgi:hypothetical protein
MTTSVPMAETSLPKTDWLKFKSKRRTTDTKTSKTNLFVLVFN